MMNNGETETKVMRYEASIDNHDRYCWKCHTKVNIRISCRSCCRSFHKNCVENSTDRWMCPVCVELTDIKTTTKNGTPNIHLLTMMTNNLLKKKKFEMFEYLDCIQFGSNYKNNNNTKIVYPMDLSTIKEKIQSNAYGCLEEYQIDIQWIYHNCFIYYSENHKFTSNAADLLGFCRNELRFMENCENCYDHFYNSPEDWPVKACDFPHLVLWVDIRDSDFWPADKGYKFWPAKFLAVDDTDLSIVFFGHHQFSKVSPSSCFLYSNNSQFFANMSIDSKDIATALEEVDFYIKNVCKKFKVYANIIEASVPLSMPIDWKSVSEHLEEMFPGLGNRIHSKTNSVRITQSTINNRSTQLSLINQQHTKLIPTSDFGRYEIPEKRYKFQYPFSPKMSFESISNCKEDLNDCMKNITGIVNNVFDLNEELEKRLKDVTEKHGIEIKKMHDKNLYLTSQLTKLNHDMEDKIELLKKAYHLEIIELKEEHADRVSKLIEEAKEKWQLKLQNQQQMLNDAENEITLLKTRHEIEVARYEAERKRLFTESYELIMRKNEEKDQAVADAREKCWREYSDLIEEAKAKKFCIACGAGKPLDLFYVCNSECQRRYCNGQNPKN